MKITATPRDELVKVRFAEDDEEEEDDDSE
jgi:hypothetical protein